MRENYNQSALVDIHDIALIDETPEELIHEVVNKVKNPYHFKSGSVEVEVIYSYTSEATVSSIFKDYLLRNK